MFVRGVKLTKDMVKQLKNNGILYVYVIDEISEGIEHKEFIPRELRVETINKVKEGFSKINSRINDINRLNEKNIKDVEGMFESVYDAISLNSNAINLLSAIQLNDKELYMHSMNVSVYSMQLAREIGLSEEQVKKIGIGSLLHDVGKMLIPDSILYKRGNLTDAEFEVIKTHTTLGREILSTTASIPEEAVKSAYQHHERLDGSGYPRGITGNEMHLFAKIIAVSDVFDAVTMNRVYQKAMLPHEGLKILQKSSPNQLDSTLVDVFPKTIAIYPPGLPVLLNTGQKAIVEKYNSDFPEKPLVRIVAEEDGTLLKKPFEIDLTSNDNYEIIFSEFFKI